MGAEKVFMPYYSYSPNNLCLYKAIVVGCPLTWNCCTALAGYAAACIMTPACCCARAAPWAASACCCCVVSWPAAGVTAPVTLLPLLVCPGTPYAAAAAADSWTPVGSDLEKGNLLLLLLWRNDCCTLVDLRQSTLVLKATKTFMWLSKFKCSISCLSCFYSNYLTNQI